MPPEEKILDCFDTEYDVYARKGHPHSAEMATQVELGILIAYTYIGLVADSEGSESKALKVLSNLLNKWSGFIYKDKVDFLELLTQRSDLYAMAYQEKKLKNKDSTDAILLTHFIASTRAHGHPIIYTKKDFNSLINSPYDANEYAQNASWIDSCIGLAGKPINWFSIPNILLYVFFIVITILIILK